MHAILLQSAVRGILVGAALAACTPAGTGEQVQAPTKPSEVVVAPPSSAPTPVVVTPVPTVMPVATETSTATRYSCKGGANDCKGQGACKTDSNACKGQNACKGMGGCRTSTPTATPHVGSQHNCKGQNACKGQGGCKTSQNNCKGQNDCKGKGGCKSP